MKIDLDKLWEPEAYEQSYPPGYSPSLTGKLVLTTDKIEPLPAQDISMNILDDLAYFEQKINKALYGLRAPSVQEEDDICYLIDTGFAQEYIQTEWEMSFDDQKISTIESMPAKTAKTAKTDCLSDNWSWVQEMKYVLGEPKSQFWIFDNEQIWMPKT